MKDWRRKEKNNSLLNQPNLGFLLQGTMKKNKDLLKGPDLLKVREQGKNLPINTHIQGEREAKITAGPIPFIKEMIFLGRTKKTFLGWEMMGEGI